MTIREINKGIRGVFKLPTKRYYLGKVKYYCPYFLPINVNLSIVSFRKLILLSEQEVEDWKKRYPYIREVKKFKNLPMVRRSKDWVVKLFGSWYWLEIGWPVYIYWHGLGWKDKFDSPRHEWNPAFYVFFFKWQFCIHWVGPNDKDNDSYWEQILWFLNYSNRDVKKAEQTWPWIDGDTKQSTWNKDYLI